MARFWFWTGQAGLGAAVGWFAWRTVVSSWLEFRSVAFSLTVKPLWIAFAALTVFLTYGVLIAAWRIVLRGWGERLSVRAAMRVWCLSNLGRYLPGKVWAVAGMAVLAQREGVKGWAAAGSAIVMQVLAVGTGVVVVSVALPNGTLPGGLSWLGLGGAAVLAALGIVTLSSTNFVERVGRLFGHEIRVGALSIGAVATAAAATGAAWLSYGVAFWFLGKGLMGPSGPVPSLAIGVFAGGYILGLVAVFAPGGVGVREGVLFSLLAPVIGGPGAAVLTVGSRLLLTTTELTAALAVLGLSRLRNAGAHL